MYKDRFKSDFLECDRKGNFNDSFNSRHEQLGRPHRHRYNKVKSKRYKPQLERYKQSMQLGRMIRHKAIRLSMQQLGAPGGLLAHQPKRRR